jgi:hypothetical protein
LKTQRKTYLIIIVDATNRLINGVKIGKNAFMDSATPPFYRHPKKGKLPSAAQRDERVRKR